MRESVPTWAKFFATFQSKTIWNCPGNKIIKGAWAVNFHKFFTLFIVYGMMEYFNNFTVGAWVYLSLHGIYGFCWLIKDLGFRDHRLEEKMSILGCINLYIFLIAWYWVIPYLFISRFIEPTGFELFFAVSLHTLGVVLMIAADGQRHYSIKLSPGLITGGVFRYTRNPNYLGEVMLYSAYAFLANHWIAWVIIAYAALTTFFPNMYNKDASISRHPGWDEYKATSGLIIPWRLLNGVAIVDVFRKKE